MSDQNEVPISNLHPLRIANAATGVRHVFVRDFDTNAHIGAYDHEKGSAQPIRINVDLSVDENDNNVDDRLENVVCYDSIVAEIRVILAAGHVHLVETLAEQIADMVLQDKRVLSVRVRVEKLRAVPEAAAVGVEIERHKTL